MHPDVQKLLQVQKVDQSIARIRRSLDSIPAERARRESALQRVRGDHDATVAALRQGELDQRGNEMSIKQADDEIKKLEVRLNTVRNNAEYQATLLQIESVKRERARLEEEGLALLERIESLNGQVQESKARLAEEQSIFDEFATKADALRAGKQRELEEVGNGRGDLIASVPPELQSRYERLFTARDGLAVCASEGGTCTGCYTSIPPNLQVKLHSGSSVVQCNSCQRILFMPE